MSRKTDDDSLFPIPPIPSPGPTPPLSPCVELVQKKTSHTVVIHSIDADGCFLPHVSKNSPYSTMAEYNHSFVENLRKRLGEIDERTVILSGSARQGCLRDFAGMLQQNENGHYSITDSYFFALKKFVDDINAKLIGTRVELDPFLLDDVCFDRPDGHTFEKAQQYGLEWSNLIQDSLNSKKKLDLSKIDEIKQKMRTNAISEANDVISATKKQEEKRRQEFGFFWEAARFPLSEHPGKFALLYTQIHYIASQYDVNVPLNFHFYDDRLDILKPLIAVFVHESELLPKNMTLNFHHYVRREEQQTPVKMLKGTGVVDLYYRKTLRDMTSKLAVKKSRVGEIELSSRTGSPLDCFFEIASYGEVDPHQFLSPVVTISSHDTFLEFNNERLIRMGVKKEEPSFANFFEEMRKLDSVVKNNSPNVPIQKAGLL